MKVIECRIEKSREVQLKFVVIATHYQGKWVYVRHKDRSTWEVPGGHIEVGESIHQAARRELYEESGAVDYRLYDVCDYDVNVKGVSSYGGLLYADVKSFSDIPESEIAERLITDTPGTWTYEKIQPVLLEMVTRWLGEDYDQKDSLRG